MEKALQAASCRHRRTTTTSKHTCMLVMLLPLMVQRLRSANRHQCLAPLLPTHNQVQLQMWRRRLLALVLRGALGEGSV